MRVFHWSLVALFAVAFMSGDEVEGLHLAAGYAIAGLIVLRIVWGFIGTRHARLTSFARGPSAVFAYLRNAALLRAPRYLGHNPAGAAMIVALIVLIAGTALTGHMMTTDAYWGAKWVEDVHEAFANLTLGLVVLHVLGVLFASLEHRENLIRAMFTGRKRAPKWPRRCCAGFVWAPARSSRRLQCGSDRRTSGQGRRSSARGCQSGRGGLRQGGASDHAAVWDVFRYA